MEKNGKNMLKMLSFFLWYEKMFNVKHFLNNVPEKQDILRIIMEVLICIIKR